MQRPAKDMQMTGIILGRTADGKHNNCLAQVTHAQVSGIWIGQKRLGIHSNSCKLLDNFARFRQLLLFSLSRAAFARALMIPRMRQEDSGVHNTQDGGVAWDSGM